MAWGIRSFLLNDEERAASCDEVNAVCMGHPAVLPVTRFGPWTACLIDTMWNWCLSIEQDADKCLAILFSNSDGYYDQHRYFPLHGSVRRAAAYDFYH